MDARKSLTVAKYLFKNYVLNPFVKRFKTAVLAFLIVCVAAGILAAVAFSLSPSQPEAEANQTGEEPGLGWSIREALLQAGIDKGDAISALGAMFALSLLLMLTVGTAAIRVMEEAEYELLLAQPMELSTYFLGREIAELAQMSLMSLPYFGFLPIAYELSGGNMTKALLFPVTMFTAVAFLSALSTLVNVVRILAEERERLLRLGAAAYYSVGAAHSLLTWQISPLLSLPFKPLAEALVHCVTITEGVREVLIGWGLSVSILLAIEAVTIRLADLVPPEFVRPISELAREARSKGGRKEISLYSPDPGASLFRFAFSLEVLSPVHLRNLAIALAASGVAGLAMLRVGPRFGLELGAASVAVSLVTPLVVAEMAIFLVGSIMARDLAAMWVLRVYALDLVPLASGLLLKYTVYLSEAFLVLGVFESLIVREPLALLQPLVVLPITVFVVLLLLVSTSYLASKRRIVRRMPTGLYMFEDIALLVVALIVVPAYMLATFLFKEVLLPRLTPQTTALVVAASLGLSWLLHEASKKALAGAIRVFDLAS